MHDDKKKKQTTGYILCCITCYLPCSTVANARNAAAMTLKPGLAARVVHEALSEVRESASEAIAEHAYGIRQESASQNMRED